MTNTTDTYEETRPNSDAAHAAERAARSLAYEAATVDGPYASGWDAEAVAEEIAPELAAQFGLAYDLAFDIAYGVADETIDQLRFG